MSGASMRCLGRELARFVVALAGLTLAAAVASPAPLAAQDREVAGQVVSPAPAGQGDSTGFAPLSGVWVILHRVGPDRQGPIDSMRTDADGRYRFRYRATGSDEALYFVSASYAGIAYFTAPLREPVVTGVPAELAVYDTTTATFPLTVRGRHIVLGAADSSGDRTIVEIFELSNDSTRTLVSGADGATPTWSISVPPAARDLRVGEGDITPDAFASATGRVNVFAPMTPGLKQLSFSYRLSPASFPLVVPIEGGAVALEVLIEDQQSSASGAGLIVTDDVAIEGRRFRRLLAQDVVDGAEITLDAPPPGVSWSGLYVTILLGGVGIVMMLTLLRSVTRRKRPLGYAIPRRDPEEETPTADRLAREIADLDAAFARLESPGDEVRGAYEKRRAELKRALADLLAELGASR